MAVSEAMPKAFRPAHQIVTEKHGGTITCTSELGKGTEFTIVLTIDGKNLF